MLHWGHETVKGSTISGKASVWAGLMPIRQTVLPGLRTALLGLGTPCGLSHWTRTEHPHHRSASIRRWDSLDI